MKTYLIQEFQFGSRRQEGTRDETGMHRIISVQILDIDEEVCLLHRLAEALDCVNWTKLVQILEKT